MTRVVVVEDEPAECEALRAAVASWPGFSCVGAFRSAEAMLRQLDWLRPEVAIVDLGLPRMDGVRCVWRLREAQPGVAVLVHTIETDSTRVFRALQAGASGYLLKGVSSATLHTAVRDLLEGGSVMTPSIARHVVRWFQRLPVLPAAEPPLSAREQEVLALLTRGYRNQEIGTELRLAANTVKTHVRRIYEALRVHSRGELFARLREWEQGNGSAD
jgi:DNA-binding NarL/FixJ family response regulator